MPGPRRSAADDPDSDAPGADATVSDSTVDAAGGMALLPGGESRDEEPEQEAEREAGGDVSLGELLRQARLDRALTLAEVERDTRINRSYLEALESERYELLPAPVYARGFLRSYARQLGLDEDAALALLPDELPRPQGLEPIPGLRRTSRSALPAVNGRVAAIVGGGVVALLLLLFVASRLGGDDGTEPAPAGATPAATVTLAAGAPSPAAGTAVATVPPFDVGETPNFIGVDRETAQALLTQLGLRFVVIETAATDAPPGQVFAQAPEPGAAIEAGDPVTLVVSRAPAE